MSAEYASTVYGAADYSSGDSWFFAVDKIGDHWYVSALHIVYDRDKSTTTSTGSPEQRGRGIQVPDALVTASDNGHEITLDDVTLPYTTQTYDRNAGYSPLITGSTTVSGTFRMAGGQGPAWTQFVFFNGQQTYNRCPGADHYSDTVRSAAAMVTAFGETKVQAPGGGQDRFADIATYQLRGTASC